jgi:hypothetical protein
MRTEEEIYASALDRPAFSNGSEWEIWSANWCQKCVHEKALREGRDSLGCPLVAVAMCHGRTPIEWLTPDSTEGPDDYHCIEFRNEDDGRGGNGGRPDDPIPGHGVLIPREPYVGTHMFVDVAIEARSLAGAR